MRKERYALCYMGIDVFEFRAIVEAYPDEMQQYLDRENAGYSDAWVDIKLIAKPVKEYKSIAEYEQAVEEEERYQLGDDYDEYKEGLWNCTNTAPTSRTTSEQ